jgi:hypothetical protein
VKEKQMGKGRLETFSYGVIAMMRTIFAVLAFLISLGLTMQAWVASHEASVANTILNNIALNKRFKVASDWVVDFRQRNGRFPTADELQNAQSRDLFDLQTLSSIPMDGASSIPETLQAFGTPPASSDHPFFLIEWGYDIPAVWASWLQTSNKSTDPTVFYTFGSSHADTWLFSAFALVMLCIAIQLWRWRGTSRRDID